MVAAPKQSYVLWFSQRVGSTLLAQALEDTGVVGRPREWLNASSTAELMKKHNVSDAMELRELLWRDATTPNGVLGIKYGLHPPFHRELTALMESVAADRTRRNGLSGWSDFFPNCTHFFLTRRDKVRLAASWWRAIKSSQWHRPRRSSQQRIAVNAESPSGDLTDMYDYGAIEHLVLEAIGRETAILEQLDQWGIAPHTIVYEDFVAGYESTVRRVLDILGVADAAIVKIPEPAFEPLADQVTEMWCDRFIADRARASLDASSRPADASA
jgi:LPS sulfotransferase NodH